MSIEEGKQFSVQYPSHPKIGNPGPLGLSGFALTTFVLSIHNAGSMNVSSPSITLGLALFYGGLAQLLAGMWEFKAGNTFGATAFSSYGGFWLSFAVIIFPAFGVRNSFNPVGALANDSSALAAAAENFEHAVGIYLLGWTIFTFILLLATIRLTGGLVALFFCLTLTFLLLTIGKFTPTAAGDIVNPSTRAGGIIGIITALIAWYNALSGLLTDETSYFTLPTLDLSRKHS